MNQENALPRRKAMLYYPSQPKPRPVRLREKDRDPYDGLRPWSAITHGIGAALALLGLDQWVKHYVTVHIPLGEAQPLLPGLVELRTVHNYGAAWSSLAGMRWLLVAITGVIIAAVAVILIRRIVRHPVGVMAGFLILSGGLGNIVDRVRLGYVVDMFHLEFWPSYPVFNVADICVVCGALLGAVYYLWFYEKYDRKGGDHGDADAASGI